MAAAASADKDGSCEFLEDGFEESIAGNVQSLRLAPCGCRNWRGEGSRSGAEEKRRGASSCEVRLRGSPFGKFFDSIPKWLSATAESCPERVMVTRVTLDSGKSEAAQLYTGRLGTSVSTL